mgnify:CR=1 FL=1
MEKDSGKAFDLYFFKRVLAFTRPYRPTFFGTAVAAILLTVFSVLTPLLLKEIIDVAYDDRIGPRIHIEQQQQHRGGARGKD